MSGAASRAATALISTLARTWRGRHGTEEKHAWCAIGRDEVRVHETAGSSHRAAEAPFGGVASKSNACMINFAMPRTPRWSDDDLRDAVHSSRSRAEVCRRLGLRPGGGTYASLRRHMTRLGIDTSHLPEVEHGRVRPPRRWTDDDLREAVATSISLAQVQRRLGYPPSGGMHRYLSSQVRLLQIDTSHFTGQAWARGRTTTGGFRPRPLEEILVAGSTYVSTAALRRRLIAAGLKRARCERCALDRWQGELLPLTLDHINGDTTDNRLENLRILCPNCHALTDTWCGRNRGRRTPTGREIRFRS